MRKIRRRNLDRGVNVIVVMQSTSENVQRDLSGKMLPFHLICDVKQEIYQAVGISAAKDLEELVGNSREELAKKLAAAESAGFVHGDYEGIETQLPAFFFVSRNMTVLEVHYANNIMDMPSIDNMLAKIRVNNEECFMSQ